MEAQRWRHLKLDVPSAPFWLRAFCRDDSVFWSRNFAVRAVGSATYARIEDEQVLERANCRQCNECATICMQDLGDRNWQTDCAHLIQVVVHCDELALQQLAARGCRAGGHIPNIPDDGAVELVALPTYIATSYTHTAAVSYCQAAVRMKQSNRRWEVDAHYGKLDSRGERLVGGLSPGHQVAARDIECGLQTASC